MFALVLSAWVACGGECLGEKLPEKLAACCRCLKSSPTPQKIDASDADFCKRLEAFWAEYYKTQGSQTNGGRVNYAPPFIGPTLQWAVPNSALNGPPTGPMPGYPAYPGYPTPAYPPPGY
jgi:hypothetical protein